MDTSGEPLLEGGIPGQKRKKDPPQQGKDTPEDCTPWVTHAGPENEVEPGGTGRKGVPLRFCLTASIFFSLYLNH